MKATGIIERPSTTDRLAALRETKQQQTLEKQQIRGAMDFDDHAVILPPKEIRETVQTLGGSGVYFTDVILNTFTPTPNHPSGGFFGPRSTGENFPQASGSPSRLHRSHVVSGRSVYGEFHVLPDGRLEPGH